MSRFAWLVAAGSLVAVACGGQIDPNATGNASARQVGIPNDDKPSPPPSVSLPSSSSSGGAASGKACGGTMIGSGDSYEDGTISSDFTVNTPSAFEVDYDDPISGSASLKVEPTPASYIAHKTPNVCTASIRFDIRASSDFIASGGNLSRINAGSRRFTINVAPGGGISIVEELYTKGAAGIGYPPPFGMLNADVKTTIVLYVDLTNEQFEAGMNTNPSSWNGPSVKSTMRQAPDGLQSPPAISSIEFGTTPGIASNPRGVYWIDDLELF